LYQKNLIEAYLLSKMAFFKQKEKKPFSGYLRQCVAGGPFPTDQLACPGIASKVT